MLQHDDEKLLKAIASLSGRLDQIGNALWFIAAILIALVLTVAFPEWRGIFG